LVELFENTPQDVVSKIVYLLQGKLRPDFEGIELGVAEKLAIRAISKSSGLTTKKIEEEYRKTGDLGQAATIILEQKTQTTFLVENITVERVYETLFKIARLEGTGSQDMKIKYISSLHSKDFTWNFTFGSCRKHGNGCIGNCIHWRQREQKGLRACIQRIK
jgi:DNA ligase-1